MNNDSPQGFRCFNCIHAIDSKTCLFLFSTIVAFRYVDSYIQRFRYNFGNAKHSKCQQHTSNINTVN